MCLGIFSGPAAVPLYNFYRNACIVIAIVQRGININCYLFLFPHHFLLDLGLPFPFH
jgi:hypothetical protein